MPNRASGPAVLLILGLLASGCGGSDNSNVDKASTPKPPSNETAGAAAKKESTAPAKRHPGKREGKGRTPGKGGRDEKSTAKAAGPGGKPRRRNLSPEEKRQRGNRKKPREPQRSSSRRRPTNRPSQELALPRRIHSGALSRCLRRARTRRAIARCVRLPERELDRMTYRGCLIAAKRSNNPQRARRRCRAEYRRAVARARR